MPENYSLTKREILKVIISTLKPVKYTLALWEQGATSFNRVDQWSDIDLMLVVEDKKVEDSFKIIEKALNYLSGIEMRFRLPEPTWHGQSQCFYVLKDASPYLFVDICVLKKSAKDKFLQYSIHGPPKIHFDKIDIIKNDPVDLNAHLKKIQERIDFHKITFPMFQVEVLKELNRGNDIEAFTFYLGMTYRPLVEVLRIKYTPYHYNFHTRYVYYELPKEVVSRLHRLLFVSDAKGLKCAQKDAEKWFFETLDSIDIKKVKRIMKEQRH